MADFFGITASNRPRLKDPDAAQAVMDHYYFEDEVEAEILIDAADGQPYLSLTGYDWPGAWKIPADVNPQDFTPDYDLDPCDGFEDFLRDLALCLAEPLTVQAVGSIKCRFPLSACEWHVRPGTTQIQSTRFRHGS